MKNFRNLQVWYKSHDLTKEIFKVVEQFPRSQQYILTSQLTRAAISIEANIAEGCCRGSDKDFNRFLQIAMGSASETDCLIELAKDLEFINQEQYTQLHDKITEILKMLSKFISKMKT